MRGSTATAAAVERAVLGFFLVLLATSALFARGLQERPPEVVGAASWQVYGTTSSNERDGAVPGAGVVAIVPRAQSGEPWSGGAVMTVPGAIAAGERVTAVFWARAERTTRLTAGLQGGAPKYERFAAAEVMLRPEWRQVTVSGVAHADFRPGSQSLSVPTGQAVAKVTLGPVAFVRGSAEPAMLAALFRAFHPAEVATDVRVESEAGVRLAGTLHLPANHGEGPFPLAVLIQGNGPNGRGGYTEVVKRLTADGIAALEYDKRGIGQSTGIYKEDVERLTADAAAAVAAMRARPDIDGRRVALVGHSQGGVVAPAVAAADPTIAAVVTLAGSVGDGLPYLQRAIRNQMIAAGRPEAVVVPAVDAAIALLQARIDGADTERIAALRAMVLDRFEAAGFSRAQAEGGLAMIDSEQAYTAYKLRSASDLRALHVPVLAVFGTKDPLVVASNEAPAARDALVGNRRARVVVLEGLSHWFQDGAETGGQEEVASLGPNLGSPRLVTLLGDWLRDNLARGSAPGPVGRR